MAWRTELFLITLIVLMASLFLVSPVLAFPAFPSSFYGKVTVNQTNFSDGTLVEALINGYPVAQGYTRTYQGVSVYSLDVPGDNPDTAAVDGGKEGDIIRIRVGGTLASQTGTWHSGTNVELDLTVSSQDALHVFKVTSTRVPARTSLPTSMPFTPTFTVTSVLSTIASQSEPAQDQNPAVVYPVVSPGLSLPATSTFSVKNTTTSATASPVNLAEEPASTITPPSVLQPAPLEEHASMPDPTAAVSTDFQDQKTSTRWLVGGAFVLAVVGGFYGVWSALNSRK